MFDHSRTWIQFNYACVLIAYVMLGTSFFLMPLNIATKGYLAMGIIFLSGSLITLVKTLHDNRIQGEVTSKLERAKQDKLLEDYVKNN